MLYKQFADCKLSRLGFGAMRLPTTDTGAVDEAQVEAMVRYAMDHGVNYFDTAYPYHNGQSELVLGRILRQYPRDSFYLADKYPGHQIAERYDPAEIFEEQLKRCQVDYFDFYLLHNVYENSIKTYNDPRWGIMDYFIQQKRQGRIQHLGFSCHGGLDILGDFLDRYGSELEFCQIQLNYLDWTLQDAKAKYELLTQRGVPVWVMEPVRGGMLADLAKGEALRAMRPEESVAAWGFRWLQGLPNVTVVLSGMSNMEQMVDNVKTYEEERPLSAAETEALFAIAEGLKKSVPCTKCGYCLESCPQGLAIPMLLAIYNEVRVSAGVNAKMRIEALPPEKQPTACLSCGSCAQMCPQHIDIPAELARLTGELEKIPSWVEVSRQRAAAQK